MIVLLNPWSTPSAKAPLPMSLLAIGSMLEGRYEYAIVDGNLEPDPIGRILALHAASPVEVIAVTVMAGPQLTAAVHTCRRLRQALPHVVMIWGGYFPSQHAAACLSEATVDICVRGQGEAVIEPLIRAVLEGGALDTVPGITYRAGASVRSNPALPPASLDALPDWPYHRVPMDRHIHRHYLGDRVTAHHTSFGCPHACRFCAVVGLSNHRWVAQSPERVGAVLERHRRDWAVDAVQFHDMDFFISEARTEAIADRLRTIGLTWWALGRVDELMRYHERTWRAMTASGLKMVFCGAESGSTEMLRQMNKGGRAAAELTLELAARMKSYGVVPEFSFVVGNPPDPAADLDVTLQFIRRLKRINPATEIILYTYTPVPLDGAVDDPARAVGFTFPETLDEWVSEPWRTFALRRDPATPWAGPAIRRRVREFESVLNAYYPTVTDGRLTGPRRLLLKLLGAWRYHFEIYRQPLELYLAQRAFHYQRPETTGF